MPGFYVLISSLNLPRVIARNEAMTRGVVDSNRVSSLIPIPYITYPS
jgi:hypothetical protein